ncbi:bifunctional adenosylcobinamide kinase/adenosylcobinamide-phosphate guanylyltransferase [Nocardioides sp. Bht2]|uniref:bifunctional adenosylcobinamide kinase/adenosylcobinamide-phosphate guanylyltransferase n=1 Tax=Nocardioides sp. Bht2 TaxID=3392297 RepID=UPI0039B5E4C3
MAVRLIGTGAADGWPTPFCSCASCTAERSAGRVRAQAAALVDGQVLLDCAPSTPLAAERLGISLADVRLILHTHQHTDHFSPATLMYRSWVTAAPLLVVGPADVVETARHWVAPDADVSFQVVAPGDTVRYDGFTVRVLEADHRTGLGLDGAAECVLYDLTTPRGERILYATDTGPLPDAALDATRDADFDLVLLEESFGDRVDHGTRHLDLATFPDQLRRLRAVGAITDRTRVVATHLSHHNPPTPELARRLADWGAEVHDDGATLLAPDGVAVAGPLTVRTLVLGGARSGKSVEAERLLADRSEVHYLATSYPPGDDAEWVQRVDLHQRRRPANWTTVETLDLVQHLSADGPPLLIDCLTLWLTRIMDRHDGWDDGAWATGGEAAVRAEMAELATAWAATARRVVAVSNEVGQGVVPNGSGSRRFRDEMGRLNSMIASVTEDVRWCVAGKVQRL